METFAYVTATGAFLAAIIFAQIGNVLATRTERESAWLPVHNKWITTGIALELYFVLAITTVPLLQSVFHAGMLHWTTWLLLLVCPFVIFFAEEIRKWIVRTQME